MLDFLNSLFGAPKDAQVPRGNIKADNLPQLMAYLKQPTQQDKQRALFTAMQNFGQARSQGMNMVDSIGQGAQGAAGMADKGRADRLGELQQQIQLRDLFKPKVPTRRESFGTNTKDERVKWLEDIDPYSGAATKVPGSEMMYDKPVDEEARTLNLAVKKLMLDKKPNDGGDWSIKDDPTGSYRVNRVTGEVVPLMNNGKPFMGGAKPPKPMTATLQKYQDEQLKDISGIGQSIIELDKSLDNLDSGKLNPSFAGNLMDIGRNKAGYSTDESRALSDLQTTTKSMLSALMAQANGTQTERDAITILEGIADNITDKEYLKQRLPELRNKFQRVMEERLDATNMMRTQQGFDELSPEQSSRYRPPVRKTPPPSIAAPQAQQSNARPPIGSFGK